MESHDEKLVVTSPDNLSAAFERARTYAEYNPQATAALLSALVLEGIVTDLASFIERYSRPQEE